VSILPTALLTVLLAAGCDTAPQQTVTQPVTQLTPAIPDDVLGAARAALGPDAEVLAFGDFADAGGRQVLAIQRLAGASPVVGGTPTGSAAGGGAGVPSGSGSGTAPNGAETTLAVIRVSIVIRDGNHWTEAFRADAHLKNGKGYLNGAPGISVPAWRMSFQKTAGSGFRLEFMPMDLPPGTKAAVVNVAWNAKSKQYEALDASRKRFLGFKRTLLGS
jgi:hypothetical protein